MNEDELMIVVGRLYIRVTILTGEVQTLMKEVSLLRSGPPHDGPSDIERAGSEGFTPFAPLPSVPEDEPRGDAG